MDVMNASRVQFPGVYVNANINDLLMDCFVGDIANCGSRGGFYGRL